jgi:hypothetical protein
LTLVAAGVRRRPITKVSAIIVMIGFSDQISQPDATKGVS